MVWNNEHYAYIGQWSDGRKFSVGGDAHNEAVHEGVVSMLQEQMGTSAWYALSKDEQREIVSEEMSNPDSPIVLEVEKVMGDPLTWSDDMHGVKVLSEGE